MENIPQSESKPTALDKLGGFVFETLQRLKAIQPANDGQATPSTETAVTNVAAESLTAEAIGDVALANFINDIH